MAVRPRRSALFMSGFDGQAHEDAKTLAGLLLYLHHSEADNVDKVG